MQQLNSLEIGQKIVGYMLNRFQCTYSLQKEAADFMEKLRGAMLKYITV